MNYEPPSPSDFQYNPIGGLPNVEIENVEREKRQESVTFNLIVKIHNYITIGDVA